MHLRGSRDRGARRAIAIAVTAVALLGLFTAVGQSPVVADDPPPPPAVSLRDAGVPVRLKIPAINVDAAIEDVGLTADNRMEVPKGYDEAAWYRLGPRPGERGNAVISGHVDSRAGVALFWDLRKLAPGDTIGVIGDDGGERHFVVTALERYAPGDVPLARIFGGADGAHLNLITCDADTPFDRASGSYAGFVLVYADAAP